jgi:TolA-binding protein
MMRKYLVVIVAFLGLSFDAKAKLIPEADLTKEALLIELTGKDYKRLKEEDLYAEVITAYRSNNGMALRAHSQTFLRRFAGSHFADNVLYLQGQLALQNRNYAEALRHFQKIYKSYPHSNKVVSAQFSKAVTYKKLNLVAEARRVLREVMNKYPGSPESFRAEAELKLLN